MRIYTLPYTVLRKIMNTLRYEYSKRFGLCLPFLSETDESLKILHKIKEDTFETSNIFRTYRLFEPISLCLFHPSQNIFEVENASVSDGSDIICTPKGVIWDKRSFENFSKVIPTDSNLVLYNQHCITIKKSKNYIERDYCFSMLGVHAAIWSHFLAQFLPKLYYAKEAGLLDKEITILFPNYKDAQIRELLYLFLIDYPNVICEYINDGIEVRCKKLVFAPTASILSNHAEYLSFIDCVIPKDVIDRLYSNLVSPLVNKAKDIPTTNSKVFLARKGVYRGMGNYDEVEQYFVEQGFLIIEPHKLSLLEKVSLFNKAEIIVGPLSSAFSNLIFCQDRTKVLILNSIPRLLDMYLSNLSRNVKLDVLMVVGNDNSSSIHTNFSICIEKVIAVYNELING